MAISDGKITAPVKATDPYGAFAVFPLNGYDVGTACYNKPGRTNQWSKIKPVRYSRSNTDGDPNWFKGDMGDNYGFSLIGGLSIVHSLPSFGTQDGLAYFRYNPPSNGEWARLTDWDGYNHKAKPPIQMIITQLTGSNGLSRYRLTYSQDEADILFSDFFKYNPASVTNPQYRLAFIYRTESTLTSNYQYVLSYPNHKWGTTNYYEMEIQSWESDAGKKCELSVYLCLANESVIPSHVAGTGLSRITPLVPLIFNPAGKYMTTLSVFTNAAKQVEPITINYVDLLAGPPAPTTWVITFRIHFSSTSGNLQTLDLSQYTIGLSCISWGGRFKFLNGSTTSSSTYSDLSGIATASGSGDYTVTAKITYSGQQVANYIMHSFTEDSVDSTNYPKGLIDFSFRRKSDQKVLYSTGINYRNRIIISI